MEIPLNVIHNYIGFPVLMGLGIDTYRRFLRNKNTTSLYFSIACILASIAMACFCMPVLFTQDSRSLSIGTFIGDCSLALSMMMLWLICTRAFLGRYRAVSTVANIVIISFTGLLIENAVTRNLGNAVSTEVTRSATGALSLSFTSSMAYNILTGIDSLVLFFIALFFWRQADAAPDKGQRLRIRSIAVSFIILASPFYVAPALPLEEQYKVSATLWALGALVLAAMNLIGSIISSSVRKTS